MNDAVIIFDLDGVIVDSLAGLYGIYESVLSDFDCIASKSEFDYLNGPSLSEICHYLIEEHQLNISHQSLLDLYNKRLQDLPNYIRPVPHAIDSIRLLSALNYKLAIASSGPRKYIEACIEKLGVENSFIHIASGEDVERAKPHPDIYQSVIKQFPNTKLFFAIEDSVHGVKAALMAGCTVLGYDSDQTSSTLESHYTDQASFERITNLLDVEPIVSGQNIQTRCLAIAPSVAIEVVDEKFQLAERISRILDESWERSKLYNPTLFDDHLLRLVKYQWEQDKITLTLAVSDYKYLWAKANLSNDNSIKEALVSFKPIGLSGLIMDSQSMVLLAKRSDSVTHFPSYWETLPSGTYSATTSDFKTLLLEEFREETGMSSDVVENVLPFCLTFDHYYGLYDLNCILKVSSTLSPEDMKSEEYSEFALVDSQKLAQLDSNTLGISGKVVPNSQKIANVLSKIDQTQFGIS